MSPRPSRKGAQLPTYLYGASVRLPRSFKRAKRLFLLLDFDGTLVEIASAPSQAIPRPETLTCLETLAKTPGISVAIVSGRPVENLQNLIGSRRLFYVGTHGVVILTPRGKRLVDPLGRKVIAAIASLKAGLSPSLKKTPGIFLENKDFSFALHFRLAKRELARRAVEEFNRAVNVCQEEGFPLEILRGKEMVEAKPAGVHKGKAVTTLLDRYGRGALPIYIGDDVTDEDAFQSLGARGISILVAENPRPTAASFYLRNPAQVREFLKALIDLKAGQ